jgi:hypothetical protein
VLRSSSAVARECGNVGQGSVAQGVDQLPDELAGEDGQLILEGVLGHAAREITPRMTLRLDEEGAGA